MTQDADHTLILPSQNKCSVNKEKQIANNKNRKKFSVYFVLNSKNVAKY